MKLLAVLAVALLAVIAGANVYSAFQIGQGLNVYDLAAPTDEIAALRTEISTKLDCANWLLDRIQEGRDAATQDDLNRLKAGGIGAPTPCSSH